MSQDDEFWNRIEAMPAWEAEQECVARRQHASALVSALNAELAQAKADGRTKDVGKIGAAIFSANGQFTKLNERISYLRRLQDKCQWKEAVKTLYGQEAFESCVVWMERQYQELYAQRRGWVGK